MRDLDIRAALHAQLELEFGEDGDTLVLDELGIDQGYSRIDVAVVNGALHGYEIKSERDTLTRLPAQATAYGAVFDAVTIVTGPRHLTQVEALVPPWWGVTVPHAARGALVLDRLRPARANPNVDPHALVQLLWRDETLGELEALGLAVGLRSKPRRELWRVLADAVTLEALSEIVRDRLRGRRGWRSAPSRASDGGPFPLDATSAHSRT